MKNIKIKIFAAIIAITLTGAAFWFFLYRGAETEGQRDISVPVGGESADISETYANSKYGFSFNHSKELNVSEFADDNSDIVLVQPGGFQVLISPFDESGPITKGRILKDIPDMKIINEREISVGGFDGLTASGEKALNFISKDESGETLETWFVHNGNLYQITAEPDFASKLEEIIKTWRFGD